MNTALLRQPESETTSQNAGSTGVIDRRTEISRACPTPEQRFPVCGWRVGATFTITRQIIAQWRRRVRLRNELITLSEGDLRDIGWTRAEVEAERRKPFWRT
jgi:uncharacterized protein YjiS (DUF1127 family)